MKILVDSHACIDLDASTLAGEEVIVHDTHGRRAADRYRSAHWCRGDNVYRTFSKSQDAEVYTIEIIVNGYYTGDTATPPRGPTATSSRVAVTLSRRPRTAAS